MISLAEIVSGAAESSTAPDLRPVGRKKAYQVQKGHRLGLERGHGIHEELSCHVSICLTTRFLMYDTHKQINKA